MFYKNMSMFEIYSNLSELFKMKDYHQQGQYKEIKNARDQVNYCINEERESVNVILSKERKNLQVIQMQALDQLEFNTRSIQD